MPRMKEVCVRASWVPSDRRERYLRAHNHELMCPRAARIEKREADGDGEGFVDYLHGSVPAARSKCYLVYYFFENYVQYHAFYVSFEEAKQEFNEWIARVDIYEDAVRMTEETTEGHMYCTSCLKAGEGCYEDIDKKHAVILRVIDLDNQTC